MLIKQISKVEEKPFTSSINTLSRSLLYVERDGGGCTDKKKIKFSSYIGKFRVEQLQSHMRKGFLIYEEMHKYFPIYEEAVSHI